MAPCVGPYCVHAGTKVDQRTATTYPDKRQGNELAAQPCCTYKALQSRRESTGNAPRVLFISGLEFSFFYLTDCSHVLLTSHCNQDENQQEMPHVCSLFQVWIFLGDRLLTCTSCEGVILSLIAHIKFPGLK